MLLQIPSELIVEILSNLEAEDLASCCIVCKRLNAIAKSDTLWIPFCEKYMSPEALTLGEGEYQTLYCTLLQYYGFLINPFNSLPPELEHVLWISSAGQYLRGCCIQWIWSAERNALEAYGIENHSTTTLLFSIYPADPTLNTPSKICKPAILPTEEGRKLLSKHEQNTDEFKAIEIHRTIPEGMEIPTSLHRENTIVIGERFRMHPVIIKHHTFHQFIAEGLWVGEYSSHGAEILHFDLTTQDHLDRSLNDNTILDSPGRATYATLPKTPHTDSSVNSMGLGPIMETGARLVGHKLTGDFNIAADTDSFVVFLDHVFPSTAQKPGPLKFWDIFPDVRVEDSVDVDQLVVTCAYQGYGRIALHNMQRASWTPIIFIILENPNLCGVIWLELGRHSLFFDRLIIDKKNGSKVNQKQNKLT